MKAKYHDPKVGDIVRLNDTGLEICFGHRHGLAHMKTLEMTVIGVESESVTYPEVTYPMDVDHPDIGMLLVDNWCFDLVRRP
jgi:hypothetical protein